MKNNYLLLVAIIALLFVFSCHLKNEKYGLCTTCMA